MRTPGDAAAEGSESFPTASREPGDMLQRTDGRPQIDRADGSGWFLRIR